MRNTSVYDANNITNDPLIIAINNIKLSIHLTKLFLSISFISYTDLIQIIDKSTYTKKYNNAKNRKIFIYYHPYL